MKPERIRIDQAAAILGVPRRTVQDMANRGELPAAKIGRLWTFDEHRLRSWILNREEATQCQKARTRQGQCGAAPSSIPKSWLPGNSSDAPLAPMIREWRRAGLKRSAKS